MNRPIMKEKYVDPRVLAAHIDELSKLDRLETLKPELAKIEKQNLQEIVLKNQQNLINGLKKKNEGRKDYSEAELMARLDHASQGVTTETRQQEHIAMKNQQIKNRVLADKINGNRSGWGLKYGEKQYAPGFEDTK